MADVHLARNLLAVVAVEPVKQSFATAADVQKFIQRNNARLTTGMMNQLQKEFNE